MIFKKNSNWKVDQTDKNLFLIMEEFFSMKEKVVRNKVKACGYTSFKTEEWDQYLECLTGVSPCPYCHAPRKESFDIIKHRRFEPYVCVANRLHYHMEVLEDLLVFRLLPKDWKASMRSLMPDGVSALYPKDWRELQSDNVFIETSKQAREEMLSECKCGNLKHACLTCIANKIIERMNV
jgi:hypothetical protein